MGSAVGTIELAVVALLLVLFIGPREMLRLFRHGYRLWVTLKQYVLKVREEMLAIPEVQEIIDEVEQEVYGEKSDSSP